MAYAKTNWVARAGVNLKKFLKLQETDSSVVLENAPDLISTPGTPFSPENMNRIEQGIEDAHAGLADETQARQTADQSLQAAADSEAQERSQGDSALAQRLSDETQARQAADQSLQAAAEAALSGEAQARSSADAQLQQNITAETSARADGDSALNARIDSVENLGHYAGAYDTRSSLPANKNSFPNGVTANDFATVRNDETKNGATARYIVTAIDAGGAITWAFDLTYTTDISGKADKVANAASGNFAALDAGGNLIDSGKNALTAGGAGPAGPPGLSITTPGFIGLYVNPDGDLYVQTVDGGINPCRYDAATGNLYYAVGGQEFLVGNVKGADGAAGAAGHFQKVVNLTALGSAANLGKYMNVGDTILLASVSVDAAGFYEPGDILEVTGGPPYYQTAKKGSLRGAAGARGLSVTGLRLDASGNLYVTREV